MDPFVAEIRIFPFNFAPKGWAFCNGQLLPISQNTALFSLLGTTYGGDGKSTARLPLTGTLPRELGARGRKGSPVRRGQSRSPLRGRESDWPRLLRPVRAHAHQ